MHLPPAASPACRRTLLTSFGGVLAIGVTAATHTSLTPLLLAAALALGTACLHAYVDATHPPVLGPFYSYERRTGACVRA